MHQTKKIYTENIGRSSVPVLPLPFGFINDNNRASRHLTGDDSLPGSCPFHGQRLINILFRQDQPVAFAKHLLCAKLKRLLHVAFECGRLISS